MELQQLKGFLAVARHGSFSKAAGVTSRTQPAVSLQVSSLEDELGVTLFERRRNESVLTTEGELLRDMASPLVSEFDGLIERFEEAVGNSTGSVTLATHNSVMRYLLPGVVRAFREEFPDTNLSLLNRSKQDILQLVESKEADFGITTLTKVPSNVEYRRLKTFRRLLLMPKGHVLSGKKSISLSDIAGKPLILPPQGSNTRANVDQALLAAGFKPQVAMEIAGRDSVKEYVRMGFGLSILNEYYIPKSERRGLCVKDVTRFFGNAERGIVIRKKTNLSKWAASFLDILKNHKDG